MQAVYTPEHMAGMATAVIFINIGNRAKRKIKKKQSINKEELSTGVLIKTFYSYIHTYRIKPKKGKTMC